MVDTTIPPNKALANGIIASLPGANCIDSGSMEATSVSDVISMGRERTWAAASAASRELAPSARRRLAKSTHRIELLTSTPIIISLPISDWILT